MKINEAKNIHFIGIGGIGVSALANILQQKGAKISGSDQNESDITKSFKKSGAKISIGHQEKNINSKIDLVIYSPAIPAQNPELKAAKKLKIRAVSYPKALGEFSKDYFTIAIAGTHGKSTTTAMTALVLTKLKLDPTVIVGTKVAEFKNKNFRIGKSNLLVVEACEYRNSFHNIKPSIAAITNIEADHLDFFHNEENYLESFTKFLSNAKTIIGLKSDKKFAKIVAKIENKNVLEIEKSNLKLSVPGEFNKQNASLAEAIALTLKGDPEAIKEVLKSFSGTWRRMENKKTKHKGKIFIDDYAHHPSEIKVTLGAIRSQYPKKKILCIFQPHQYSRTAELFKDFSKSFKDANAVIIPNIYQVRDTAEDLKRTSAEKLSAAINKNGTHSIHGDGIKNTAKILTEKYLKDFDIIVTMGAGDIPQIYKYL